jgi:hypothetical protein
MSDPVPWDSAQRCINGSPGLGCGILWEMILLALSFWASACVSCFFIYSTIRQSSFRCFFQDHTILFWIFLTAWQLYHGVITLIDIPWTLRTFQLCHNALNHILMFIPMCLVILILFDILFTAQHAGVNAVSFFRMLFSLFLITFVILGCVLSFVDSNGENDADRSLSLWCASTDIILAVFFALPAPSLLNLITAPMREINDLKCLNLCKVGTVLYVCLFGGRALWNGSHYFGINLVQNWLVQGQSALVFDGNGNAVKPSGAARAVSFVFVFVFDLGTSVLAMGSVYLFKKHRMTSGLT